MSSIDALTDEPNVVNRATTAVPTISAAALPAMRRGLRIALRRARRPVKPRVDAGAGAEHARRPGGPRPGPRTTKPTSIGQRAEPGPGDRAVGRRVGRDDGERRRRRRSSTPATARSLDGAGAVDGDVAQRGERGDPRRLDRRGDAGDERRDDADDGGDDDRAVADDEAGVGQVEAGAAHQGVEAGGEAEADAEADRPRRRRR